MFLSTNIFVLVFVQATADWVIFKEGVPSQFDKNSTSLYVKGLSGTFSSHSLSQLPNLEALHIQRNHITEIEDGALCLSPRLRALHLDFFTNKNPPQLSKHTFQRCQNLETVHLVYCFFCTNVSLPDDVFSNLNSVNSLTLAGVWPQRLHQNLLGLPSPGKLTNLALQYCNIDIIDANALDDFTHLETLEITGSINLDRLPNGLFKNLKKLTVLNLSDNGLQHLTLEVFRDLHALEVMIFSDNKVYFSNSQIRAYLPNLIYLRTNESWRPPEKRLKPHVSASVKSIMQVNLLFCVILLGNTVPIQSTLTTDYMTTCFPGTKRFKVNIDATLNLGPLTRNAFKDCRRDVKDLTLQFKDNRLFARIDQDAFADMPQLTNLTVQNVVLANLSRSTFKVGSPVLKRLVLDSCNIETIEEGVFDDYAYLEELEIVHNIGLTRLPHGLLRNNSRLKRLVLRDNALADLDWDAFEGLVALEELNLRDNQISGFNAEKIAKNMPKLEKIEIALNPVKCDDKNRFKKDLKKKYEHAIEVSEEIPNFYFPC